jgi:hypothetical protein
MVAMPDTEETSARVSVSTAGGRRFVTSAAAITAFAAALGLGIGVLTPAHGGILCVSDCVPPPYTDVAGIIVGESVWIYPALVMTLGFVALTAGLYELAQLPRRIAALMALAFALMSAVLLVGDYAVLLMAVKPSIVKGEGALVAGLSMYDPHGLFIALENAGYFLMGLAFLGVAGAIEQEHRLGRAIRWTFLVAGALAVGGLGVLWLIFGDDLDVRYEVFAISVDYLALSVGGAMLTALHLRDRQMRRSS